MAKYKWNCACTCTCVNCEQNVPNKQLIFACCFAWSWSWGGAEEGTTDSQEEP